MPRRIVADRMNQYDDVSQAAALLAVKKIKTQVAAGISTNEETKAHRENLVFLIDQALDKK